MPAQQPIRTRVLLYHIIKLHLARSGLRDYALCPERKYSQKQRPVYEISFLICAVKKCSVTGREILRSLYQWNWKTRKLKAPTRMKTKIKTLTSFSNLF